MDDGTCRPLAMFSTQEDFDRWYDALAEDVQEDIIMVRRDGHTLLVWEKCGLTGCCRCACKSIGSETTVSPPYIGGIRVRHRGSERIRAENARRLA